MTPLLSKPTRWKFKISKPSYEPSTALYCGWLTYNFLNWRRWALPFACHKGNPRTEPLYELITWWCNLCLYHQFKTNNLLDDEESGEPKSKKKKDNSSAGGDKPLKCVACRYVFTKSLKVETVSKFQEKCISISLSCSFIFAALNPTKDLQPPSPNSPGSC